MQEVRSKLIRGESFAERKRLEELVAQYSRSLSKLSLSREDPRDSSQQRNVENQL